MSCGCECVAHCDWNGVVANAVAALSLLLIVGVFLGSPDASDTGVNTWHVFTSTPHEIPAPGVLPQWHLSPSPREVLAAALPPSLSHNPITFHMQLPANHVALV